MSTMRPSRPSSLSVFLLLLFGLVASGLSPATAQTNPPPALIRVKAGVAVVDATWHVGASAGQYASDELTLGLAPESHFDPHKHQLHRAPSYGIQSRLSVRAIVVEGNNGTRVAFVKNDLYIPQDMLWRRTAQILEENGTSGIDREHLTTMSSHNHSSPFYSSTTFGPWLFQDSFDLRFFEYYAQAQAEAVEKAAANLKPARVGASVSYFDKTARHSYGPAIADDGTPAGFPQSEGDHDMMIVRFDDMSNPFEPKPLAILANFAVHPEFLEGNDLNSADYLGPLERMVDRETGAVLVWSQGSVGTAEPERNSYHSVHERLDFTHKDYRQAEYGARLMADSVIDTWNDVAGGTPEQAGRFVPFSTNFPVLMIDRWYPGPISHPYPGVSNCRTDQALSGNPRVPAAPECVGPRDEFGIPPPLPDPGITTDDFEALGIPIPENYSMPSYNALEESMGVHLQAARLGEILLTMCSCEQWSEQSKNLKTRTDLIRNNIWKGFDWAAQFPCTQQPDTTWKCPNPHNTSLLLSGITDHEYKRMRAQVNNDAKGWNDPANVLWAESEPVDTTKIWGNFLHKELPITGPGRGYPLTIAIGMANDYNGYIASYREFSRGDHYRKSLTGWGPHSSDYLASRHVEMAGLLHNGPALTAELLDPKEIADQVIQDAKGIALGAAAETLIPAYEALLPDDGGTPRIQFQPSDITRFKTAFFTWFGGSNYTDLPEVTVERLVDGQWKTFGDMSGEVIVTLEFPKGAASVVPYLQGRQQWRWTAHFEAFDGPANALARTGSTPAGQYRFVVDGHHRKGRQANPYHLVSRTFDVRRWGGINVEDIRIEPDGHVSVQVGPRSTHNVPGIGGVVIGPVDYPDSYASPIPFIRNVRTFTRDPAAPNDPTKLEWFCNTCTFRNWADTGKVTQVKVTIRRAAGGALTSLASLGPDGRWHTTHTLLPGDTATVEIGNIGDEYGNFNAQGSPTITA
ncbi:MAG: neutral/alkaline non-lysosomal ceramidase N-terminal domain-containing protein [Actinomycetota bacterium]